MPEQQQKKREGHYHCQACGNAGKGAFIRLQHRRKCKECGHKNL